MGEFHYFLSSWTILFYFAAGRSEKLLKTKPQQLWTIDFSISRPCLDTSQKIKYWIAIFINETR